MSKQVLARRAGVAMLVLAMVLQSVVVFQDYAQAASDDMIQGGVGSKEAILAHYDKNTNNFRDVLTYNGITRAELANMSNKTRFSADETGQSWGWTSRFTEAQGERKHSVAGRTIYSRPQKLWDNSWYMGWEGHSATSGKFRIISSCGNLLTYAVPQPPTPTPPKPPTPQPQPVATCDKLTITKLSRTRYAMAASASAKNGATISAVQIHIYDANGKRVGGNDANGTNGSAAVELTTPGTYTVKAIAKTSLGDITSTACTGTFTIPEEPTPTPPTPTPQPEKPSVDIAKTVNKHKHVKVNVGEEFTYDITVKNTGKVELKDVVITDTVPAEVTLTKASAGKIDGKKWTHTVSTLKAGESQSFSLSAKYDKYVAGTHKNTVCVDTPTVPGTPDDCDEATTVTVEVTPTPPITPPTPPATPPTTPPATPPQTPPATPPATPTPPAPTTPEQPAQPSTPAPQPAPTTPPVTKQLPVTGALSNVSGVLGLGGLASVTWAYIMSRRALR